MNDAYCADLPTESETGDFGSWLIVDEEKAEARLAGRFLGSGSSRKPTHRGHAPGTWGTREDKCSACRWLELMIFQEYAAKDGGGTAPTGKYLVVKVGASEVDGETDRISFIWALSADEVVVAVSTRGPAGKSVRTRPAEIALARAAGRDPELRDAFRATV